MLPSILSEQRERVLAEERGWLGDLRVLLARLEATADDERNAERSLRQLDQLFLLVVVGEFNAGKSVFINALLGRAVLPEGVTPTTSRICLLQYGASEAREVSEGGREVFSAPVDLLREIQIVDTPGTNALEREHEALTRDFVPAADLVLFVTSADRPFTESERSFLESVRTWGKKIVVVLNKIDILETEEETARVVGFVEENARRLLGERPEVFPLSSRQALRGKLGNDATLLERSRFPALETHLASRLDEKERVRLKLLSPLGVGEKLLGTYREVVAGRLDLLRGDLGAIEEIERQLNLYQEDLGRDFRFRLADVDNVLLELENRGVAFFEETLRLPRLFELMNKAKVKADFESRVVADLPRVVEKRVSEIIDWLIGSELRQWQAMVEELNRRRSRPAEPLPRQVGRGFEQERGRLLASVGREAQRAVETYDRNLEANRLAESVQLAVASAALLEVGAVGLGTIVTLIASTTAADVTGLLAAGAVSVLGLLVLPARRRRAKSELRRKVAEVREKLMTALTAEFQRELEQSRRRMEDALAPYTRFVRAERDSLESARKELERLAGQAARLKAQVAAL
jgi:small GTP-binding protein